MSFVLAGRTEGLTVKHKRYCKEGDGSRTRAEESMSTPRKFERVTEAGSGKMDFPRQFKLTEQCTHLRDWGLTQR